MDIYSEKDRFITLSESQLRQLSDAQAVLRHSRVARQEAQEVRGSMRWKTVGGRQYLLRVSPRGAERSLGPQTQETQAIFDAFHSRKSSAQARLAAMRQRMDEMRQLNRVYQIGRAPSILVRCLNALEDAGLAQQFLVVGTHALYAYETAAGVRVQSGSMATQDLDLLFDVRKLRAFTTLLKRTELRSLIAVLQRADKTFKVRRDKLETAVNDDGFEVDIIRRMQVDGDPHPLRLSDDENDFWAVQADQGQAMASSPRFAQMVVSPQGEMAIMHTLHPLVFIRLKHALSQRLGRDPLKAPKDKLQAQVVQALWDRYLQFLPA